MFKVVLPNVMEVGGLSVTERPVTWTPELLVIVPSKSTRIPSPPPTATTATEHSLVMFKGPGATWQLAGNVVAGGTIQEVLAGEMAVPPELVALTVAVFGVVSEADEVLKLPL